MKALRTTILCLCAAPRLVHPTAARADCVADSISLAPDSWNVSAEPFPSGAVGQTFYARETLLSKLTVWRPPGNVSSASAQLFITAVDSVNWNPPRPDTHSILLYGPSVRVDDSTPPGGLIEMAFVIDPPLALPRPGYYAWLLKPEVSVWDLVANDTNPYPSGMYWQTARSSGGLPPVEGGDDRLDLLFRIEFCAAGATPARSPTWGDLKLLYR